MSTNPNTSHRFREALLDLKLEHYGWVSLEKPLSIGFYKTWLDQNHHGDMGYLKDSLAIKADPRQHFAPAQSLLSIGQSYFPGREPSSENMDPPLPHPLPVAHLKVAHYANQEDYHFWLKKKLQNLCDDLQQKFPDEVFLPFTDAVPLLERDHARQGGLGWVGKNTCLIHPKKGSLFFIAEIITSIPCHEKPNQVPDFCGTCTRCMDACPTGALETPKVLEAQKCISYWNIEAKVDPPENLRPKMGDWLFGCDICQTVCPWNVKIFKNHEDFPVPKVTATATAAEQEAELRWILSTSNKKLMKALGRTPLNRAGGRGLKRNAMIVAANLRLTGLSSEVQSYENHPRLGDIARWALKALSSGSPGMLS